MTAILNYLKAHATSLSSYVALLMTLVGVLLASGVIGPDVTAYRILGGLLSVLTTLGFKALPVRTAGEA